MFHLNIKVTIVKLLEVRIEKNFKVSLGKDFLVMTQKDNLQKKMMTNWTSSKCKISAI